MYFPGNQFLGWPQWITCDNSSVFHNTDLPVFILTHFVLGLYRDNVYLKPIKSLLLPVKITAMQGLCVATRGHSSAAEKLRLGLSSAQVVVLTPTLSSILIGGILLNHINRKIPKTPIHSVS